jgi:hypothetical protein
MKRIRRIVGELRTSLADGGIEAMAATHEAALRSSLSYRLFFASLSLLYPAGPLLDLLKGLDRQVEVSGFDGALGSVLDLLPASWRVSFPPRGEDEIRSRPIIVFGRHGSILTPFLVAMALERSDLKMIGATYVAQLGPNIADRVFAVHLSIPSFRRAARRGILLRLGAWLVAKLDTSIPRDVARERNRTALTQAGEHVLHGGALLVAPDAHNPKAEWRTGIGWMIERLAQSERAKARVLLVPYRVWAPILGIFHLLSCNPILRAIGRWQYRRPARVVFGEPFPLSDVIDRVGTDPVAITRHLEHRYGSLGL